MGGKRYRLARRRKAVGFTQEGLAEHLGVDPTTVRRWESGETEGGPQPWLWPKLARCLQVSVDELEDLLARTTPADTTSATPTAILTAKCDTELNVDGALERLAEEHRKRPRRLHSESANHVALLGAAPESVLANLREQWHLLVQTDNLFGPIRVLRAVHEQIELIEALLQVAPDTVRGSLLSLGAEYSESAAWLHEDAGDQVASCWTARALEWAHAADDRRLVAWALFRRSQQVAHERDAAQAVGLARAAHGAGSRLPDQMRAAITQQEAYGLALDGDEAACQRKLDESLHWAAPADLTGDARSGHGAFCTTSYVELQRAKCWHVLGRARRAVTTYEMTLPTLPAAYNRDRGYGLAQFASALVTIDEIEHAAKVASEALTISNGCGSGRTLRHLRGVGRQLRPHVTLPCIAQFLDDLAVVNR